MTELIVTVRMTDSIDTQLHYYNKAGIKHYRINLGRSNPDKNNQLINKIRREVDNAHIYLDIPGKKERIQHLDSHQSIQAGDIFCVSIADNRSTQSLKFQNSTTIDTIATGDILIFGDNAVKAQVLQRETMYIELKAITSGRIKSRAGIINLSKYVPQKTVTEQERIMLSMYDAEDICWGISFADTVERIEQCRQLIKKGRIIAKVESPAGVANFPSYFHLIDGLMLARGDLGVFYSVEEMDKILEDMLVKSNGKLPSVIAATNYFYHLGESGEIDVLEQRSLRKVFEKSVAYVMTNETSHSQYWKEIIQEYIACKETVG